MATLMWRGFCFPFLSAIASMGIGACFFLGGEGLGVLSKCGLILGSRSFKIPWDGLALGPKLSYNNISIDVFLRSVSCRCFHILCFISKWGGLGMNGTWMDTNICSHVVCTSKPTTNLDVRNCLIQWTTTNDEDCHVKFQNQNQGEYSLFFPRMFMGSSIVLVIWYRVVTKF